jgi:ankyrin repeat protein
MYYLFIYIYIHRYFAIEQGLSEIIRVLVTEHNFLINDPCTLEKGLFRPIHVAINLNKIELLPLLLELGADIDLIEEDGLLTPLHLASFQDNEMIVKFLIDKNANSNIISKAGYTALYIAISKGNTSITRLIIEKYHIDVNSTNICSNKMSCLHVAGK